MLVLCGALVCSGVCCSFGGAVCCCALWGVRWCSGALVCWCSVVLCGACCFVCWCSCALFFDDSLMMFGDDHFLRSNIRANVGGVRNPVRGSRFGGEVVVVVVRAHQTTWLYCAQEISRLHENKKNSHPSLLPTIVDHYPKHIDPQISYFFTTFLDHRKYDDLPFHLRVRERGTP